MSGVTIGSNNITINGRIIETAKSNIEPTSSPSVPKITIDSDYKYMKFEPIVVYDAEKMYPPIRNVSSQNHSITGQAYGNGFYVTSFSSLYEIDPAYNIFNTTVTTGGHWDFPSVKRYIQPDGTFRSTLTDNIVSGYNGDWLKIRFPVAINLTRYAFQIRTILPARAPQNFKIYGSNDEINWIELTHGTNPTYVNGLYDTSITTSGNYNSFGLVVNKIVGGASNADGLNFDEWFIYGKVAIPQTPYTITFNENTEVQLLLLDSTKYITTSPFNISTGSLQLIVGINGSFSSFSGVSTGTNGIIYGAGFVSTITGSSITYNTPLVILKYKYINLSLAQWTYNASTPNVFHLGNVGIGTTNPTSALHVLGSVQVNGAINATSLTANTKNFKIEHPLNINKWLYHGCVESPRFDNIYRGKKKIINGIGEVDIDEECNTTGGMTKGTFVALNTNCQVYLQNKESFARVKGIINGSKITINCNNTEEIEVDWLVIGERKDDNIKSNELTNNEGKLICEHEM